MIVGVAEQMSNADVVGVLTKLADLLEIKGENQFKIRAYRTAAEAVENLGTSLSELVVRPEGLAGVSGFGSAITQKVTELLTSGRLGYLEELEEEVPPTLLAIRHLHGVGPKTAALLWREASITTLEELSAAIEIGRLEGLPRLGTKTIEKIGAAVAERLANGESRRRPREEAEPLVQQLLEQLRGLPEAERVEVAGSYRRGALTVGDLDVLVATMEPGAILRAFAGLPQVDEVLVHGETKCSVMIDGLQVDCRAVAREQFGAAWQYFTGSKQHNIAVRGRAQRRGLTVNEYGVAPLDGGERVAGKTEEEVYAAGGMRWVPPIERRGGAEIEAYSIHSRV
jgi:DNA polymerase (family 10)